MHLMVKLWTLNINIFCLGPAGQFATQTCFNGRFGEEAGSDQFGAAIMMHAPHANMDLVNARIEHVEVKCFKVSQLKPLV